MKSEKSNRDGLNSMQRAFVDGVKRYHVNSASSTVDDSKYNLNDYNTLAQERFQQYLQLNTASHSTYKTARYAMLSFMGGNLDAIPHMVDAIADTPPHIAASGFYLMNCAEVYLPLPCTIPSLNGRLGDDSDKNHYTSKSEHMRAMRTIIVQWYREFGEEIKAWVADNHHQLRWDTEQWKYVLETEDQQS